MPGNRYHTVAYVSFCFLILILVLRLILLALLFILLQGSSMEVQQMKSENDNLKMEIDTLLARLISSEESLRRRNEEREEEQNKCSRDLRHKDAQLQRCEENVSFFKTQVGDDRKQPNCASGDVLRLEQQPL